MPSSNDDEEEITNMEEGETKPSKGSGFCGSSSTVPIIQKVIAEAIGTYLVVFAGCCSVVLNVLDGRVTFPGVCVVWGLAVMIMVYAVGHISGGHFNPAVTVTFSIFRQFPLRQVPLYIIAQVVGSILASGTLYMLFEVDDESYFGTLPSGSNVQSLVMEIITSFLLMFVVSAVATDTRAIGELAGIAVGMTIAVDVFIAGVWSINEPSKKYWASNNNEHL
ncbi:probable aquaporin NIP-type isoform X2 [Prosopis cineraria]|uniref:probable aquaporin NIP-type isoform X2 n=1 Tax=Prosopis cineraria TaxID=364024 RepID=UPI00240F5BE6|nr:probable aquaporin NIP-type isoform X2 [Prosopis cineraria]XP_054822947.1 probable aquaporin NIP-type isoform X2 [Prosopis cineraria]